MGERKDNWIPFSNGSEYDYWRFHNCERCKKDYNPDNDIVKCELEQALALTELSPTQAERIGTVETPYKHLGPCKELEPR